MPLQRSRTKKGLQLREKALNAYQLIGANQALPHLVSLLLNDQD